jgi:N-acetylglucosaminyldiphosphoundecaprenol N-acetyl-beta-D-mannosaminyltransferase
MSRQDPKERADTQRSSNVVMNSLPSVKILGSRVHLVPIPEVVSIMDRWIREHRPGDPLRQIIVTGFHGLWEAHQDAEFRAILNSADLWIPDGIAPVWIARLRGHRGIDRTPGAEVMEAFFELANQQGYKSYFYGDTEDTLAALRTNLERRYPGHSVVGMVSPPFRSLNPEEEEEHVRLINESGAHVLWVGLGLPKQDRWIYRHRARLKVPLALGVGAAFRFLAGLAPRVPAWIGRNGFEWAWRLAREPRKIWRRALFGYVPFVVHVALELTGLRRYD